jgi:hypothetical protein
MPVWGYDRVILLLFDKADVGSGFAHELVDVFPLFAD